MKTGVKICAIFNIAPLYRRAIFSLMDTELGVRFYFGERSVDGIAMLRGDSLGGFGGYLRNLYRGSKLVWQRGALRRAFLGTGYGVYILTGNAGILSNWFVALVARLMGRRVVLWSHGLTGAEGRTTQRKNMLYFKIASHIMLYGHRAKERMVELGVPHDKMTVIYNSLDYDTQIKVREKVGDGMFARNYFGSDDPYFTYVGRLTKGKKIDMLIRALTQVDDCNLILIGSGDQQPLLESLVAELGLEDRVWFQGECYDEQHIGTVLYNSAACVSPGSVGLTAIHAMTFGAPVISHGDLMTQLPESETIEKGRTGDFFEKDNLESLVEVMKHYRDMNLQQRATIRQQCYNVIESKYNPHVQIQIMKEMIHKLQ